MTLTLRSTSIALLFLVLARPASSQFDVDATIRLVDSLYMAGSYALAELEARRMLENDLLSDSIRTVAQHWVACALVAQEKPILAKQHFLAILQRHPASVLDPVLTSPKILAVFNDARATMLASRTGTADSVVAGQDSGPARITFRTIVFPGWEQWYQGRTTLGPILAGAGVATLGAGIALEFMRSSARKKYLAAGTPEEIAARYDEYRRYRKAEIISFVAFGVVYLLSEVDVFTHNPAMTLFSTCAPSTAGSGFALRFSLP